MIKIVDVGCLRDNRIEAYLTECTDNKLALTEFACMESLKGGALTNIKQSLEIVAKYSNQVLVLKGGAEIIKINFDSPVFKAEFVDRLQTATFPMFCKKVIGDPESDRAFVDDLLARSNAASRVLDEMIKDANLVLEGISALKQEIDKKFLKIIRSGKKWTRHEYNYALDLALVFSRKFIEIKSKEFQIPKTENFINHYIFRWALSSLFLALWWLEQSGSENYTNKKMRNDIVDMSYVAYGSYYSGVLSNDKKINAIYSKVVGFMSRLRQTSQRKKKGADLFS